MKFYYNGKLVRTSKTHEYHFGILNADGTKVTSCHGTYEAAMKEMNRRPGEIRSRIAELETGIKAIQAGKSYYLTKICGRTYKVSIGKDTEEDYRHYIDQNRDALNRLAKRKIVELEARD